MALAALAGLEEAVLSTSSGSVATYLRLATSRLVDGHVLGGGGGD
jgi:hypothetical protein